MTNQLPLSGNVAVVAGATRGAGRGIARMLGEAGATVYCTGRSSRATGTPPGRPETIEETAELVTAAGGHGIAVRVDHSRTEEAEALFARVKQEQGKLDILVNDIWGGDEFAEWLPFWQLDLDKGMKMLDSGVRTHLITSRYGVPMMVEANAGLIVEITDGDFHGYRGTLVYDLAKMATIRMAFDMAQDLRKTNVTALAVTPGFLRSEAMLDGMGVTEANWIDAASEHRGFEESETPCYVGRAVAALAADPNVGTKAGGVYASWTLAKEYGFIDIDGRKPDWETYVKASVGAILDAGGPNNDGERFWVDAWYTQLRDDARYSEMIGRISESKSER